MADPATHQETREPDLMGFGYDDGTVWYPRSAYPTRSAARTAYANWTGAAWIEISVLSRWARYAPELAPEPCDWWVECPRDTPGAFEVWRCE